MVQEKPEVKLNIYSGFCFVLCQLSVIHPAKKNSLRKEETHSSMSMCLVEVHLLKKTKHKKNKTKTKRILRLVKLGSIEVPYDKKT